MRQKGGGNSVLPATTPVSRTGYVFCFSSTSTPEKQTKWLETENVLVPTVNIRCLRFSLEQNEERGLFQSRTVWHQDKVSVIIETFLCLHFPCSASPAPLRCCVWKLSLMYNPYAKFGLTVFWIASAKTASVTAKINRHTFSTCKDLSLSGKVIYTHISWACGVDTDAYVFTHSRPPYNLVLVCSPVRLFYPFK